MKVKDPFFILDKIRKYLDEDIFPARYRECMDIEKWKYLETSMQNRILNAYEVSFQDMDWHDFTLGETWGGYDKAAWFRTKIKLTNHFRKGQMALRFLVGPRDGGESTAETLLYVDGVPVQGVDIWHEEIFLPEEYAEKEELQLALNAWSGVLAPPKYRTFKVAQLIAIDKSTDRFYFIADTLLRCAGLLPDSDLRKIHMIELLQAAMKKINYLKKGSEEFYFSVKEALDILMEKVQEWESLTEIKPMIYGLGHSHIDMAWLWRLNATREKASRTFSTVLNLMRQYPEYKFMHSSPQLYMFLQEDYPQIFAKIKEKVMNNQWEITGGMWVEADTNIPSGESLVRQFLYGKKYIKEEFGKDTHLLWLPDVFGYSAALPQIMKKSGIQYFMTTKISWNQYNRFPHDTFLWKGIDGSSIFTHFITTPEDGSWFYTYNGRMMPEEVVGIWENYKDKDKNEELLLAYGWGDGGGGPTREMLERMRAMKNIPGIPKVKSSGAEEYFQRIYHKIDHSRLAEWNGELYFELHRGTYTSQAASKLANRQTEVLLHNIEAMSVMADKESGVKIYPQEDLEKLWHKTLLNQFHDILPGSSIRQVYEDVEQDYTEIREKGNLLLDSAKARLINSSGMERGITLYNLTGFCRSDYALLPYGEEIIKGITVEDEKGNLQTQETEEGLLVYAEEIPAYGYKTYRLRKQQENNEKSRMENDMRISQNEAETPFYYIHWNANGEIDYLYDKENGRLLTVEGQPMNKLQAYEDKPLRFDAWDVDVFYKEKPYPAFVLQERKILEQGRQRIVLRQKWSFHQSSVEQDCILYRNSRRIDFKTVVDWREQQVFLKVYFPTLLHTEEATYEIQFGSIKRPTHQNTAWDLARFEVPGHRYADLSESDYGIALLNDSKYGWNIEGGRIGLSLIKSAIRPDETADQGEHRFVYSLYPHTKIVEQSNVLQEALNLNQPLLLEVGRIPQKREYSFVRTDSDHILIDTLKKAEKEDAVILRLYEYRRIRNENVNLQFGYPIKKVVETNLMEEEEAEYKVDGNQFCFSVRPFEIKTFKVFF